MPEFVQLSVEDGIACVTLDDPDRRNAVSLALSLELQAICEEIDRDPAVGAVLLRGAGGYFCSGGVRGELAEIGRDPSSERSVRALTQIYGAFLRTQRLEPPTVAAVTGGAVGAGLNLALAADVRVVAEDAVLKAGFQALGLHPGGGHLAMLGRAGGYQAAIALGVLGEAVDGVRAAELGLAWRAVPAEHVEAEARRLVSAAAADPELARATARSARLELGPPALPLDAAVDVERASQLWSFARRGGAGR